MSNDLMFSDEELAQLRGAFFEQATEVVDSLGGLILSVERDPGNIEALRAVKRAVHTLKGDASAFGFDELMHLAHRYEDALNRVATSQGVVSQALIDLLLAGADSLAELLCHYRDDAPKPDLAHLFAGLDALNEEPVDVKPVGVEPADAESASAEPADAEPVEAESVVAEPVSAEPVIEAAAPAATGLSPQKPARKRAPRKKASANPTPVQPTQNLAEPVSSPALPVPTVTAAQEPIISKAVTEEARPLEEQRNTARQTTAGTTLRVESERIDAAMNLIGELIIQRSMIASLSAELAAERQGNERESRLKEAVDLTRRTLSELQESVMRMRLVAIDQVFRRFPRVVRDASIKLGKPLRLEVSGGQTEIDKSIVEVISDPLIHLIRNACDHGIESPEVRRAAGKPEEGVINLCARRVGNQIAVEVEDDGGGINPEKVVAKALQKGLVNAQEIKDWSDHQKISLIFLPEFSTKETVSDLSGRGVGMDVVKTTVDSLGGSIAVSSVLGQGSRFTIKLPLTMAIVRAMLFETAGRRFALPLDEIREITRIRTGETKTVNGREVLRLRERVLPLIRLDEALGLRAAGENHNDGRLFVFVLELGDGRVVGLAVERLYGEQELVLKTVDASLIQSELVAGASILGDGQVVLILDQHAIIEQASIDTRMENITRSQSHPRAAVTRSPARPSAYA
jgi:two-component system, chemotaxis family, sensor kinase CheA